MTRGHLIDLLCLTAEDFEAGWGALHAAQKAEADWDSAVVWLPSALSLPRRRPDNGNVIQGWRRWWDEIPESPMKHRWLAELVEHAKERGAHFERGVVRGFGDVADLPPGYGDGSPEGSAGVTPNKDQDQDRDQEYQQGVGEARAREGAPREPPPVSEQAQVENPPAGPAGEPESPAPSSGGSGAGSTGGSPQPSADPARLGVPPGISLGPDALRFGALVVEARARKGLPRAEPALSGRTARDRATVLERLGRYLRDLVSEAAHEAAKLGLEPDPRAFDQIGARALAGWFDFPGSDGHYLDDRGHPIEALEKDIQKFGAVAQRAHLQRLRELAREERQRAAPPRRPSNPTTVASPAQPVPSTGRVRGRVLDLFAEWYCRAKASEPVLTAVDHGNAAQVEALLTQRAASESADEEGARLAYLSLLEMALEQLFAADGPHSVPALRAVVEGWSPGTMLCDAVA
ncbi:MAG: hypothetical protein IT372_42475 [Polyangiaceae bacterium]|nr:hypothetical protein [Polyangiaceae bacterium]